MARHTHPPDLDEPWRDVARLLRGHIVTGAMPPGPLLNTAARQLEAYGAVAAAAHHLLHELGSEVPVATSMNLKRALQRAQEEQHG